MMFPDDTVHPNIVGKRQPDDRGTETPGTDTGALLTRREDSTVTWSEVVHRGGTNHTEVSQKNNPVSQNKV
jgi:hypothetical protein